MVWRARVIFQLLRQSHNPGELYAREGRRDEADRVFREGLGHGTHPDLLNNLAWLLLEEEPREAERLAAAAVALEPGHAAAWDTLGAARLRLGDAEGARTALERGIALRPALPDLHYHLAAALLALGDSDGARAEAREALALLGEREAAWAERARRIAR
jgi:Flp pilus assembly protein TadD